MQMITVCRKIHRTHETYVNTCARISLYGVWRDLHLIRAPDYLRSAKPLRATSARTLNGDAAQFVGKLEK